MPNSGAKLFQSIRVGESELAHRVVFAPLTRYRADETHVPTDVMAEYYAQRASVPGTLLITEATFIAARAAGYEQVPGVWSDVQVEGCKKGLWAIGSAAIPDVISQPDSPRNPGGPYPYVSASVIPLTGKASGTKPHALTHDEILVYIELYGQAAHNVVHRAGFDGVEIHGAHECLIDQFTQDVSNERTEQWGGSTENKTRFAIRKVASVVGEERNAICPSLFSTFQAHVRLPCREAYPRFSYLHVVEPRALGSSDRTPLAGESNDFPRTIWKGPSSAKNGSIYLNAGGYSPEDALEDAERNDELVVFERHFISNPDLPARIKINIPLTPYDRETFYTRGNPVGYVGYAFADVETEAKYKVRRSEHERADL